MKTCIWKFGDHFQFELGFPLVSLGNLNAPVVRLQCPLRDCLKNPRENKQKAHFEAKTFTKLRDTGFPDPYRFSTATNLLYPTVRGE